MCHKVSISIKLFVSLHDFNIIQFEDTNIYLCLVNPLCVGGEKTDNVNQWLFIYVVCFI